MLVDLIVKNFALIDELEIHFSEGLNVLTGETGAGKSIVIGALEILLGARASIDLIRKGKEKAYIEAAFESNKIDIINDYLHSVGIEPDPQLLLLSREIRRNGNNRNRINGQLATAGMIKDISKYLVDIHGQHEHQRLLDSNSQLNLLDEFIAFEELGILDTVRQNYMKISKIDEELSKIDIDEAEKARTIDLLEFQLNEIESAALKDNEIEDLDRQFKMMANMEEIYASVGEIQNKLQADAYNESSVLQNITKFMKNLNEIQDYDDELKEFYDQFCDIYYQLEDISFRITSYHENLEFDQNKLGEIENRLAIIASLQRKYGQSVEEIKKYQIEIEERLNDFLIQDQKIEDLTKEKEKFFDIYMANAEKLSKIRHNKALELEKMISQELSDLGMENTIFKINFSEKKASKDGIDKIEFMIAPNVGEDLKPLSKIASGGELSRIMLALKTIIAHLDQVDTLVFDEVDAGVGGKIAQMMAEKLAIISKRRQVLCITHLAQIASMGDNHFFISKEVGEERTSTKISKLNKEERMEEIARMLGGIEESDTTLKHAEEMYEFNKRKKVELI
ncbi:DNA repair protein RecN [Natronospora cellulosivora (SeqCode)]